MTLGEPDDQGHDVETYRITDRRREYVETVRVCDAHPTLLRRLDGWTYVWHIPTKRWIPKPRELWITNPQFQPR